MTMHPALADALRAAKPKPIVGRLPPHAGGRTDTLPIDVPPDSFVIPADVISFLGEGSSAVGHALLEKRFPQVQEDGPGVPIMAAGDEMIIGPKSVRSLGNGSIKRGMDILHEFVLHARKEMIKETRAMKKPHR